MDWFHVGLIAVLLLWGVFGVIVGRRTLKRNAEMLHGRQDRRGA